MLPIPIKFFFFFRVQLSPFRNGGVWSRIWLGVQSNIKMIFGLPSNIVFVRDVFIFISKFEGAAKRTVVSGLGATVEG